MIEVRHLSKRFGTMDAIAGVSFRAPNGQITGLLGANGAGKTTTLAAICGLIQPDEGTVRVGETDHRERTATGRRRQVGALLDHKGLYEQLTARENIEYFGALHRLSSSVLTRRVNEIIGRLGLGAIADRRVAAFSQGERMKVALGRAIVHAPPHVLLDEPTNGLDIPSVLALREVLRDMRDAGTCILFSSHVLDEVRALCDTIVILSHGRVVGAGTIAEICRDTGQATLEAAFLTLVHREAVAS
jgi:sodium transport system ATP-binding protein